MLCEPTLDQPDSSTAAPTAAWPRSSSPPTTCWPTLRWPDIEEALAAHPRIGERTLAQRREDAWSRQEQSGAEKAEPDVEAALREGNAAYERRFNHVFLISATGLSAADMLAALRLRLANSPAVEQRRRSR